MTTTGDGLLYLLRAEPTLLPPAPADSLAAAMDRRRHDEVHPCLRCGLLAHYALVAHTEIGNRWLDLCILCTEWLRANTTQ